MILDAAAGEPRLDEMFAAQAAATPERPAVFFRGATLSYSQLSDEVDAFARQLVTCGVGPGVIVALCLTRTPKLIALVLAVLRAGGAYLPLDPRTPGERLAFMLTDSGAPVLVTDGAGATDAGFQGTRLEVVGDHLIQRAYEGAPAASGPGELAYVIYTSGSTGRPKGVMLGRGAAHLMAWAADAYSPRERSRVAATTSLSFDPSVFEIFVPLCTGGAVVLKENALEPFRPDERPTMVDAAPSVLREWLRAGVIPDSVEVLNVGGEALPADLVADTYRRHPALTIYNHYGPTEATTCVTVGRVPRDLVGEPCLGQPVRRAEVFLFRADGEPAPDDETGEIYLGGPGLALGYLNLPDLTAERFPSIRGQRLYRTGDLAVRRGGELYFRGRADRQVKVRGVRIEPGEIEAALLRDPGVEDALVVPHDGPSGPQLVGYVQSQQPLAPSFIREHLASLLPSYMTPAHIVVLAALPRLVSGKVDHAALPAPLALPASKDAVASRAERPIVHVFEEVLGRSAIGPNDSFFDLGGDSLASLRASLRLEEVLGREVPAALLFQAPTARELALALQRGRLRLEAHLSLLQPGGPGPPLFCVADLFGQPFNYLGLARELARERTVYGLAPGPLQAAFTADGDVERLTAGFKAEVQRVRPQGPYLIAGYSAGGLLAAELAAALERDGHSVRLVLLDALLHSNRVSIGAMGRLALTHARRLLRHGRLKMNGGRLRLLFESFSAAQRPRRAPAWIPRGQLAFALRMMKVGVSHRPAMFNGPALVVMAQERPPTDPLFNRDGLAGWSSVLAGEVQRSTAPGGHHTFMRAPNVATTALSVQRFLNS